MSFLMNKQLNSLEDLLVQQLDDLYDAERQIIDALPKMEEAAKSADLKKAFRMHLDTTKRQVQRLEDCFRELDKQPGNETCNGMRGIIDEGEKIVSAEGDADVRDAGLDRQCPASRALRDQRLRFRSHLCAASGA